MAANLSVELLRETDVSKITGRSVGTLRKDRCQGEGIPYLKIGKSVRYSVDDVNKYLESRRVLTRPHGMEV